MSKKDLREKVFTDYNLRVRNYILGKVNNFHLAEDLCSEVFDKVYAKIDTFDEKKASLSTWVFTIARNTLIDYYRTNRVNLELKEDINIAYEEDDEDDGLICNSENLEKLADALSQLNDKEKKVIVLHYYDGLSLKDACKSMGISYPYIKIIHRSAISKLQKHFK